MTHSVPAGAPTFFPFLRYKDPAAAVRWLVSAFGFAEHVIVPGPQGTVSHAELSLGAGVVMLGPAGMTGPFEMKTARELGGVSQGIYVHVRDVDGHYARAKGAGATIVMELRDQEYGSREYAARDLEGNLWCFGTYHPSLESTGDK